jgi:hypothetical protein
VARRRFRRDLRVPVIFVAVFGGVQAGQNPWFYLAGGPSRPTRGPDFCNRPGFLFTEEGSRSEICFISVIVIGQEPPLRLFLC